MLDLLEAWRRLAGRDTQLVLVGPEMPGHHLDAGPAARRFVAEHGLADTVTFFGPASDPAPLLRAADLFVQPSHYEAFGLSALEALASGLPIVATGVGGLRDFLTHEATALLCEPERPDQLAASIARLLDDSPLAARLAARGRLVVDTGFGEKTLGEKYRHLFQLLLSQVDGAASADGATARPPHAASLRSGAGLGLPSPKWPARSRLARCHPTPSASFLRIRLAAGGDRFHLLPSGGRWRGRDQRAADCSESRPAWLRGSHSHQAHPGRRAGR